MKELKNYRDEIFRRSDEKKRQIKKRRRIALSVCIPLCLCCVITVAMRPNLSMKKDALASDRNVTCENGFLEDREESVQTFQFAARVVEYAEGWVLVEPLESEAERNSCDRISFGTRGLKDLDIRVGTEVVITYDGQIMESYPAQIYPLSWELK